jgi:molybdopterin/thiamine biosynthesis adenylyltransferase
MMKNIHKFKVLSSKKQRKSDKDVRLVFPEPLYRQMRSSLDSAEAGSREGYVIAQCGHKADISKKNWIYFIKSVHVPSREDLFEQSSITVTPKGEFMERILVEAAEHNSTVLEIHTHVDSAEPNFSWVDIENGIENGRFLKSCGIRFAMAVLGSAGFSLSEYETDRDAMQAPAGARISLVSRSGLKDILVHKTAVSTVPERPQIGDMRVAIVGVNGVGSEIAHMLASMGVSKFILIDDRLVDGSEPLPYTVAKDKGKRRTKALYRSLKKISQDLEVAHVNHNASDAKAEMRECDLIFGCVGGHEDRLAMNEVSLKYFKPLIDTGEDGNVRVIVPSVTGCLGCQCRVPVLHRTIYGDEEAYSAIASAAVQEFVDLVKGEGHAGTASTAADELCPLCGRGGILGAGDEQKARR